MAGLRYLWFDARVVTRDGQLMCLVAGHVVPHRRLLMHPSCRATMAADGDSGRLGLLEWWATFFGLSEVA